MKVNTRIFGEIDIDDSKIITFENGIIGFSDLKKFALIFDSEKKNKGGISWLQSLEDGNMALPVLDPLIVKPDYSPYIEDEMLNALGKCEDEDYLVLVTVTVPSDIKKITVNLKAPIIINTLTLKANQIISENEEYLIKFPKYDIIKNGSGEGR